MAMDAMNHLQHPTTTVRLFWGFVGRVLRDFRRNQGLLLAGAIAYYSLLSIVPMTILGVFVFSHFLQEQQLQQVFSIYLGMMIPGYSTTLAEQVQVFYGHRNMIGIVGLLAMLFFSSIAFSMLENAMSLIFYHRVRGSRRNILVSAVIPYIYIFLIGLGMIGVSMTVLLVSNLNTPDIVVFGWDFDLVGLAVYLLGLLGEFFLFSSVYLVMPAVRVKFRYALVGGLTAMLLWELSRRILVWYYAAVSMVDLIYGPIAIVIGALLSVEVAAIIILLGAQVIAELVADRDGLTPPPADGEGPELVG
ncbi:MAG TPA: ribonuclease R [Desulfuromonas sp.]|nr:ribonuclease R [Desulfuromonas sp.]